MSALRLLAFAEADADFRTLSVLVDRVLSEDERTSWTSDLLDVVNGPDDEEKNALRRSVREWIEDHSAVRQQTPAPFVDLHYMEELCRALEIQDGAARVARGHFSGTPGDHCSKLGRKVFFVARLLDRQECIHAVVLMQDMDGKQEARRSGLEQAREESRGNGDRFEIVLGCPEQSQEAWRLSAFEPVDAVEAVRLKTCETRLGFAPCLDSARLLHQHTGPLSSSKALDELTAKSHEVSERGLRSTPLDTMRARGEHNGLVDFLVEVEARLVPLMLGDR